MVLGIYEQSAQSDHCLVARGPDPCHHLRPFAADLKGRPKNIFLKIEVVFISLIWFKWQPDRPKLGKQIMAASVYMDN